MQYLLLYAGSVDVLNNDVGAYLRGGWEPLGAPFISTLGTDKSMSQFLIYQAVVKRA